MRIGKHAACLGAVVFLCGGAALAQPPGMGPPETAEGPLGLYGGLGLEQFRVKARGSDDGTDFDITTRPVALTGRLGYNFLEWLSIEAHAAAGVHDDPNSGNIGSGAVTVRNGETELEYHAGVAAVPEYRFVYGGTTVITVFGLLGYNAVELEGQARNRNPSPPQSVSYSLDENGEYWGGGLRLDGEAAGLRLQYTRYFDDTGLEVEGYGISVDIRF